MASKGYNPVKRPNPQVDPAPNGGAVLAQFDGGIRPDIGNDRNIRHSSAPRYGEDAFADDADQDGDWD